MADKHSLNYDVRELKLGSSFTNNKSSQYHTIKYDFKPASVDVNKMATVDVGTNNQVTVTVPHLDGAGVPQTVFKGNQRPYTKECVLIIDRVTGEITLEKLSSNIQVKKTRQENSSKPRPLTPVTSDLLTNTTQRSTSRTRVATNRRTQQNPVSGGAPQVNGVGRVTGPAPQNSKTHNNMVRSPPRVKTSPPQAAPWAGGGNSTLASLPMIGLDEPVRPEPRPLPPPTQHEQRKIPLPPSSPAGSSSSSSSDSGSDSGSDSDSDAPSSHPQPQNHPQNHPGSNQEYNGALFKRTPSVPALPNDVLKDDLCLSESGSDSD